MMLLLKISIVGFIAGSLFQMGLELSLRSAVSGLRNLRFVLYTVGFGFVAGPLLAVVLAYGLGLDRPYALGLMILGLTPSAPFLPLVISRARLDPGYVPAVLLVSAFLTILVLPVAIPLLVGSADIGFMAIARPLGLMILPPLVIGMAIYRVAPELAAAIRGKAKPVVAFFTIATLVLCVLIYGRAFYDAAGSFAFLSQILLLGGIAVATHMFATGLDRDQKSTLVLAMSTRNAGAALAPLYSIAGIDERAIVMVVLSVPSQLLVAMSIAWMISRSLATGREESGV